MCSVNHGSTYGHHSKCPTVTHAGRSDLMPFTATTMTPIPAIAVDSMGNRLIAKMTKKTLSVQIHCHLLSIGMNTAIDLMDMHVERMIRHFTYLMGIKQAWLKSGI